MSSPTADAPADRQPVSPEPVIRIDNVSVRYRLDDYGRWLTGTEVYAGVNNVFGENPPFMTIGVGTDVNYDLGRFFFAGVTIRR